MTTLPLNRFNCLSQDLWHGKHNIGTHTFKVLFTNTAPVATNALYSDISGNELANGSGYTTGGLTTTLTESLVSATYTTYNSSGTPASVTAFVERLFATNVVLTATAANVGPIRYFVIYNATTGALIGWADNGSSTTLANVNDNFTVGFDQTNGFEVTGVPSAS